LKAELEATEARSALSQKKSSRSEELFKLDIISDIERLNLETEVETTQAERDIILARMESCVIRAPYDGRVTNRMANPDEYTRTDRVLLEVASLDDLELEFLLPSIWLRWVNIGAPLQIAVYETDDVYEAELTKIYGEVDPVSQSIQMRGRLLQYDAPLLPGMSGVVTVNVAEIRDAGISGFLDVSARQ
jgi:multidrug resistance efflux pump